jgi:peptide-methionine (S)-S-oxide reductase
MLSETSLCRTCLRPAVRKKGKPRFFVSARALPPVASGCGLLYAGGSNERFGSSAAGSCEMWPFTAAKLVVPRPEDCLPGRQAAMPAPEQHFVNGHRLVGGYPEALEQAVLGLGCFWGAERIFWQTPGVWVTAVGYAGGSTPNPTYEEVCSGRTGHAEVVLVVFDPKIVGYDALLKLFWEGHDPTQGMRQGNDVGTQYRSAIYVFSPQQRQLAEASRRVYQDRLDAAGLGRITTEIVDAPPFYFAEPYHQQYLAKNPHGYCGLSGTGVSCPVPATSAA